MSRNEASPPNQGDQGDNSQGVTAGQDIPESERIRRLDFQAEFQTLIGYVLRADRAYGREPTLAAHVELIEACKRFEKAYVEARAAATKETGS